MKNLIKRLLLSALLVIPYVSVSATPSGDWGFGIQLSDATKYSYSVNMENDVISYEDYGKYNRTTHTFEFGKDQKITALGVDLDNDVDLNISVNGNNEIKRLVYKDLENKNKSYTIKGSGTLTIDSVVVRQPYVYDEENNILCNVSVKYGEKSIYLEQKEGLYVTCDNVEEDLEKQWSNILKLDAYKNIGLPESYSDVTFNYKVSARIEGNTEEDICEKESDLNTWVKNYIKTDGKVEIKDSKIVIKMDETSETINTIENEKNGIKFTSEDELDSSYSLQVSDITDDYKDDKNIIIEDRNLINVFEIDVVNGTTVVPMKDGKFTIKIKMTDEMKKYNAFLVAYINDEGVIAEKLDAKVVEDELVFTTTHLSKYATYGYNVEETASTSKDESNPNTLDNITTYISLSLISVVGIVGIKLYFNRYNN